MQFSADCNQKIEVFGMTNIENSLGEIDRIPGKIKDVWAKIIPKHGKTKNFGDSNVEEVESIITIKTRKLSIKEPSIDMYFIHKGLKYEIIDFFEDFKTKSFWEFNCKVIYE